MQQAVCVRSNFVLAKTQKHKEIRPTQYTPRIHSSLATMTTSRRHATKHVPRVSPCSPASIDPGLVEIGLVPLSQSVKTTNVTTTQHSARPLRCSSDLDRCSDALRCTRTSLRAYTRYFTCALRTVDGRFFVPVISPLPQT